MESGWYTAHGCPTARARYLTGFVGGQWIELATILGPFAVGNAVGNAVDKGHDMNRVGEFAEHFETYRDDGVVVLRNVLDTATMALVDDAYEWSAARRSPALQDFSADDDEQFTADTGYSVDESVYTGLLQDSVIPDIAHALFGGDSRVWYLGEQVFLKQGPAGTRRTPWHQDTSYSNFNGPKLAALWIPLDPIPRAASLEVVRGSHRAITYNGSRFEPGDDTAPLYPVSKLPRLPDIERERDKWNIAGSALERGDMIVFHLGCLHGAGGTEPGIRRRSLVLRFCGDDVVWIERTDRPHPNSSVARRAKAAAEGKLRTHKAAAVPLGEPIWRSDRFRQVRPWAPKQ